MAKLTPQACKAARALLGWGVRDLAAASGVHYVTISRIEGGTPPLPSTEAKLIKAFAEAGVEITNGTGTGAKLLNDRPAPKKKPKKKAKTKR